MKAIISDVHGNLPALEAVLADIAAKGVTNLVCLGDIVGYGPFPRECLDRLRPWLHQTTMGNHEEAALGGEELKAFNPRARAAVIWTMRELFEKPDEPPEEREALRQQLAALPPLIREGEIIYLHASPRDPVHEYITPQDAWDRRRMASILDLIPWGCFVGHTHKAGIYEETGFIPSTALPAGVYSLDLGKKALINVGSVGQPRDGDRRACYVTFDGDWVRFCRVEYDPSATVARIRAIPELDDSLAERLLEGT